MTNVVNAPAVDMDPLVQGLITQWKQYEARIEEIDESLDAESAGRTKILNKTVDAVKGVAENSTTSVDQVLPQFKSFLMGLDEKTRAGVLYSVLQATIDELIPSVSVIPELQTGLKYFMQKTFRSKDMNEQLTAYADPLVDKNVPQISDEDAAKLREERKEKVTNANLIQQLVERTNENAAKSNGLVVIVQKRGAGGTSGSGKGSLGVRIKGSFTFHVDGKDVGGSLTDVGRRTGVQVNGETDSVKAAIAAAIPDFDFKNPPDHWEFDITNKGTTYHVEADKDSTSTVNSDDSVMEEDDDENNGNGSAPAEELPADPFSS